MNAIPGIGMRGVKHFRSYALVFLAASALAVLVSLAAQPGGISQANAFLAPLIGPWSRCLPPNRAHLDAAEIKRFAAYTVVFVTVVTAAGMASYLANNRWARVAVRLAGYAAIALWCLVGIGKVITELT